MNIHKNARLTPVRREEMARAVLEGRLLKADAGRAFGVTPKVVGRWTVHYAALGRASMADRSSRSARIPRMTHHTTAERIVALRRQRFTGRYIAREVGVSPATVSRVLRRVPLGPEGSGAGRAAPPLRARKARRYDPYRHQEAGRFERVGHRITGDRTGQSSSRGVGWEFIHVCIDDASRIAFSRIMPDERRESAVAFLEAALAFYASLGVTVSRVMTDNGSCYRSHEFKKACRKHGLKHVRTRPYTPRTNGKAERFIQTALREPTRTR